MQFIWNPQESYIQKNSAFDSHFFLFFEIQKFREFVDFLKKYPFGKWEKKNQKMSAYLNFLQVSPFIFGNLVKPRESGKKAILKYGMLGFEID